MTALPTPQALSAANIDSLERLAIALGLFFAKHTGSLPSTSPSFEAVIFEVKETSNVIPETTISPINFEDIPAKVAEYPAGIEWSSRPVNLSGGYELIISSYTVVTATIQFTCYFPLTPETRLEAGTLLLNIAPYFSLSAPTFPETSPSATSTPAIPGFPSQIESAEQLMVWALLVLNASLYPNHKTFIKILPKYEDGELRIDFDFPLDPQALSLNSYQLIGASKRIVNGYLDLDTGIVSQIALDAYDVAQAEGFIGSRAQWLASLIGPKGDKGDKGDPGDPGTPGAGVSWRGIWNSGTTYATYDAVDYLGSSYIANATTTNEIPGVSAKWDLWVSKGDTGDQGEDGKSAYQIAIDNGFLGNEAQWLASLKGDDGEPSTVPGPAGQDGSDGQDGASGELWIDVPEKTADYAANNTERIPVNTTAGIVNITVPATGDRFWVFDSVANTPATGFGLNKCVVLPQSGQTVRGGSSFELDRGGIGLGFKKIGTNWVNYNG